MDKKEGSLAAKYLEAYGHLIGEAKFEEYDKESGEFKVEKEILENGK